MPERRSFRSNERSPARLERSFHPNERDSLRMDRARLAPEGRTWRIEFEGVARHLPASKGLQYLAKLLAHPSEPIPALDLEGRDGSDVRAREQARLNVTRAIRATLNVLAEVHPSLAEHLQATLRTGRSCSYRPDPRAPIAWDTPSARAPSG